MIIPCSIICRRRSDPPCHIHHRTFSHWQNIVIKPRQAPLHRCVHQNSRTPLGQGNEGGHPLFFQRRPNNLGILDIPPSIHRSIVQRSSPQSLLRDRNGIPREVHSHPIPEQRALRFFLLREVQFVSNRRDDEGGIAHDDVPHGIGSERGSEQSRHGIPSQLAFDGGELAASEIPLDLGAVCDRGFERSREHRREHRLRQSFDTVGCIIALARQCIVIVVVVVVGFHPLPTPRRRNGRRFHQFLPVINGCHPQGPAQRVIEELKRQAHDAVLHEPSHHARRPDHPIRSQRTLPKGELDALRELAFARDLGGVHEERDFLEGHARESHGGAERSESDRAVGDDDGFFEFVGQCGGMMGTRGFDFDVGGDGSLGDIRTFVLWPRGFICFFVW
mmetsp:Transcript_38281/g.70600  ORF Transcript_38281/g.70600 Transcript_38281/m.70600 type:complete len:390 (-) Transcript_38281:616-1785(-)